MSPLSIELYDTIYRAINAYHYHARVPIDRILFSVMDPLEGLTQIMGIPVDTGLHLPPGGVDIEADGWAVIRLWKDGTTRE